MPNSEFSQPKDTHSIKIFASHSANEAHVAWTRQRSFCICYYQQVLLCTESTTTNQRSEHLHAVQFHVSVKDAPEYDWPSDQCRLEALNEARQGQVNRVKIAEKEREGLEGEKIAAEAYLHKDADRLGTQSKIFQRFIHDGQVHLNIRMKVLCCIHTHASTQCNMKNQDLNMLYMASSIHLNPCCASHPKTWCV